MSVKFSILIRHPGFIDRFLRGTPRLPLSADEINAWIALDDKDRVILNNRDDADAMAANFNSQFNSQPGTSEYRFSVIEERLVPRWFLVDPKGEREKVAIGRYEQI